MIVCIIPARFNSSRFLGKLLAEAGGKTVLQRTHECALKSRKIDELYIATDDERIASHAKSFGGNVIFTSSECKNGTERLSEAIRNEPRLQQASAIVNLQGDHPCTSPETLDALASLLDDPLADVGTAVCAIRSREDFESPHVVKCVMDGKGYALYFSRSPIPYSNKKLEIPRGFQHIGLYAYRPSFLLKIGSLCDTDLQRSEDLEQLKFLELGYRIRVALVEDEALGVDTPKDLEKLKKLLLCQ